MTALKTFPLGGEGRREGNFVKMVRIWGWRAVNEPELKPEDIKRGREIERA